MNDFEAPTWVKYAGDLFFLALFLVFLFFVKPAEQSEDEWDDNEDGADAEPNPLEKMLVSEDNEAISADESGEVESADSEKL